MHTPPSLKPAVGHTSCARAHMLHMWLLTESRLNLECARPRFRPGRCLLSIRTRLKRNSSKLFASRAAVGGLASRAYYPPQHSRYNAGTLPRLTLAAQPGMLTSSHPARPQGMHMPPSVCPSIDHLRHSARHMCTISIFAMRALWLPPPSRPSACASRPLCPGPTASRRPLRPSVPT